MFSQAFYIYNSFRSLFRNLASLWHYMVLSVISSKKVTIDLLWLSVVNQLNMKTTKGGSLYKRYMPGDNRTSGWHYTFVTSLIAIWHCWALYECHHHCGNCLGREMGIDWTWISPTAEAPGKKVGTVSLKRWQRNLHNGHYTLHFVCRSVATVRQPLYSVLISSHLA